MFVFFKQETAYELRISDWSSDVCSSGLALRNDGARRLAGRALAACARADVARVGRIADRARRFAAVPHKGDEIRQGWARPTAPQVVSPGIAGLIRPPSRDRSQLETFY